MSSEETNLGLNESDDWLTEDSDVAALVIRQWLEPVEGRDAVIFPPTYAKPERMRDEDWSGYNVDVFNDGSSVCQIDSVGSQANRMEPVFMREKYRGLVPNVVVKAIVNGQEKRVDLLEAGHRSADAIIRFSDLAGEFEEAFRAIKDRGDAEPLAKLAPTSLIFGAWDSRGTQVKLPRIVRSVIRAYNVRRLHRSAQYAPPIDYIGEGLLETPKNKTEHESMSQLGLNHAPAAWTHGGVLVDKEIRRDATLNLVAIRALRTEAREPMTLRRYILGLALVALTAPQETYLREGCQVVLDSSRPPELRLVRHDGRRDPWSVTHEEVIEYAREAAKNFKLGQNKSGTFDARSARAALAQSKEERKKSRRGEGHGQSNEP
jgi:CRISPR-associated protein Csb1